MTRRRPGRRKLSREDRRSIRAVCLLSPVELAMVDQAAEDHDMTRSEYLRTSALAAVFYHDREQVDWDGAIVALCNAHTPAEG